MYHYCPVEVEVEVVEDLMFLLLVCTRTSEPIGLLEQKCPHSIWEILLKLRISTRVLLLLILGDSKRYKNLDQFSKHLLFWEIQSICLYRESQPKGVSQLSN